LPILVNQGSKVRLFGYGVSQAETFLLKIHNWTVEMNDMYPIRREGSAEVVVHSGSDFGHVANEICEKALNDAKEQLHPLIRSAELRRLRKRSEFVDAFKRALEKRIAQSLAAWQPGILAIFQFDDAWTERRDTWDGSIHLLVKVPRLSAAIKTLGRKLDHSLINCLKQLGWSRFHERQSFLEIQQVTLNELRHGISYGAMFCAVHSVPVEVWRAQRTT
jgi:hypothetical protein